MSLGWLSGLFGGKRAHDPARSTWDGPPDQTPIHGMLERIGFPWRDTRAALAERHGVGVDPAYQWDVIAIDTPRAFLDGLIRPLSTRVDPTLSPNVPATDVFGAVHHSDDTRDNVRRAAAQVAEYLGRGRLETRGNTVQCEWRFGPASVKLIGWPRDLQRGKSINHAHERDPRLAGACHVYIHTGWRQAPSPQERAWLESFTPYGRMLSADITTPQAMRNAEASSSILEFVRVLPEEHAGLIGQVGRSADGAALIDGCGQLTIIPMADVLGFRICHLAPGRGTGRDWVEVECRTGYDAMPSKWLSFGAGRMMEAVAGTLAAEVGRKVEHYDAGTDD